MLSAYHGLICITHNTTSEAPLELFAKFLLFPNCQLFQVLGWFFCCCFWGVCLFFVFQSFQLRKHQPHKLTLLHGGSYIVSLMTKNHLLQYRVKVQLAGPELMLTSIFSGFSPSVESTAFIVWAEQPWEKIPCFPVLSATLLSMKKFEQATAYRYCYILYVVFFKGMHSISLKVSLLTKHKLIINCKLPQFFFFPFSFILCTLYLPHLCFPKYLFFLWKSFCSLASSAQVAEMPQRPSCETACQTH